jgi:hypothetical protein
MLTAINGYLMVDADASEFGLKAEFSNILIPTDNLNPGDEKSSVMTISIDSENEAITSLPVWIKSKITSNNPGVNGGDLDEVLRLKIMNGSEEVYSGRVSGFNSYVSLGNVGRNDSIDLDFYINLPGEETSNYYQGSSIRVIWLLSTMYDEKGSIKITKSLDGGDDDTIFTVNVYGPYDDEKLAGSVDIADGESKTIGQLEFGEYVFEEESKSGYTQVGTVDPVTLTDDDPSQEVIVYNKAYNTEPKGSLTIIKDVENMDDTTTFEAIVYGPDSDDIYRTVEISEDGETTIENMKYGVYTIEEKEKKGYSQVGTVEPVELKSTNKNPRVTIVNKKDPEVFGSITVYKYLENEDDDEIFEVKVYGPDSSSKLYKTIDIQMGNLVLLDNLQLGEYILEESYESGYERENPLEVVNLDSDHRDKSVTFNNEPDTPNKKRGSITVEKDVVDRNDTTSFEVKVYGPGNTDRLMKIINIKEGSPVKLTNLILGEYKLVETEKDGYSQVNPIIEVDMSTGSRSRTVKFENQVRRNSDNDGSILINKDVLNTDDNTVFYVNVYGPDSETILQGRYEISEDRSNTADNLDMGEYILIEEDNENYMIGTVGKVVLASGDRNQEVTFINEPTSRGGGGEVIVFEEFTPRGLPDTGIMPTLFGFGGLSSFALLLIRMKKRKR